MKRRLLVFYVFLFLISAFVVLFLKKETYKEIKTIDGKVVKVLPSDASLKLIDDTHIQIEYPDGKKEILTGLFDIEVKSKWGLTLEGWKYFRKGLDVAG
jgi:hypothetical protein